MKYTYEAINLSYRGGMAIYFTPLTNIFPVNQIAEKQVIAK
jgi:hypothetical protein